MTGEEYEATSRWRMRFGAAQIGVMGLASIGVVTSDWRSPIPAMRGALKAQDGSPGGDIVAVVFVRE